jgi:hypothetical protein
MLENEYASFRKRADAIPNWEKIDKNVLANLYLENEHDEVKREEYLSALVCRYWHNIGSQYNESKNSVNIEECYDWLLNALLRALKNRKWTDPTSKLYGDVAGPDKVINRCIASERDIFYQSSNTYKRRTQFGVQSIDMAQEEFGDASFVSPYLAADDDYNNIDIDNLIQSFVNDGCVIEAVIVDGICYGDAFKEVRDAEKENKVNYEFNDRKLVKYIKSLNQNDIDRFVNKYGIPPEQSAQIFNGIKALSGTRLYTYIRKTLYKVSNNKLFKELTACL